MDNLFIECRVSIGVEFWIKEGIKGFRYFEHHQTEDSYTLIAGVDIHKYGKFPVKMVFRQDGSFSFDVTMGVLSYTQDTAKQINILQRETRLKVYLDEEDLLKFSYNGFVDLDSNLLDIMNQFADEIRTLTKTEKFDKLMGAVTLRCVETEFILNHILDSVKKEISAGAWGKINCNYTVNLEKKTVFGFISRPKLNGFVVPSVSFLLNENGSYVCTATFGQFDLADEVWSQYIHDLQQATYLKVYVNKSGALQIGCSAPPCSVETIGATVADFLAELLRISKEWWGWPSMGDLVKG